MVSTAVGMFEDIGLKTNFRKCTVLLIVKEILTYDIYVYLSLLELSPDG